jgi:uncharacterized membrane protein YtjA (UPF0391 family)
MLRFAIVFHVIALIAAIFGYSGIATSSADGAKTLFFIFLVFALLTFAGVAYRRGAA